MTAGSIAAARRAAIRTVHGCDEQDPRRLGAARRDRYFTRFTVLRLTMIALEGVGAPIPARPIASHAGRLTSVHGHGPPLVFLQGVIGDGDLDWQALLPHLTDRFTCYLPSMRGRGLSDDHPDLSLGRQADDVLAYIDSIQAPIRLVGWSGGANLALLASGTQPDAVTAIAPIEPVASSVMDEQERASLGGAIGRTGQLAAEGKLTDAVRAFADWPFNDQDIAAAEHAGYFEAAGHYAPNLLSFFQQLMNYQGAQPDDPAVLGAIQARVLVLHGSDTTPFMASSARHVADHVPNARMHEIPGAGHAAPVTHPESLAEALAEFFAPVQQPA